VTNFPVLQSFRAATILNVITHCRHSYPSHNAHMAPMQHRRSTHRDAYLLPIRDKNMLKAIWTALRKSRRCLLEMNLKLTACTTGHTFHDPWQADRRSVLILFPMVLNESPLTSPKYVKKTVIKMGHQQIWSMATLRATSLASFPVIFLSNQL